MIMIMIDNEKKTEPLEDPMMFDDMETSLLWEKLQSLQEETNKIKTILNTRQVETKDCQLDEIMVYIYKA
jgi:hypothetical protein